MSISDIPTIDGYAFDDDGNEVTAAAPAAQTPAEALPDVYCREGWIVEVLHDATPPTTSPAVVGVSLFVADPSLREANAVCVSAHQQLIEQGLFGELPDQPGVEGTHVSLATHPLGDVLDAEGNVLDLDEDQDDTESEAHGEGAEPAGAAVETPQP